MSLLEPDRYFAGLTFVDIQRDLIDRGLTCVLLDVDNTVRNRETDEIPPDVHRWIDEAKAAGLTLALFSNSWHDTTLRFGRELDLPVVMRAMKPLPFGTVHALRTVSSKRRNTVIIGDQILTDVLAAHLAGMVAYLVVPLSDVNIKSALWQRELERRILAGWTPEGA